VESVDPGCATGHFINQQQGGRIPSTELLQCRSRAGLTQGHDMSPADAADGLLLQVDLRLDALEHRIELAYVALSTLSSERS
jgi:hypothetical protein